ncbi:conserved hypothetical protein [Neospora caninum Liverpool]|uniref:Pyridoxal-dependent decarboxylase domain-containing protein n=1 Tax=Neospora caninum (strain Liverpool) TaxID=572307 RepID=F0VEG4_NEOCL|nr:conserved hypothetical protein [Neospora caninum Liverpool]CBZ52108.1 conserved hypothetical protein [Neospora caninum Liverpool]|eukprot:XP_003882140.1 conserved hypothetical protein [Neospora caninum Liverpool]
MQSITEFAVEGGIYRPLQIDSDISSKELEEAPRGNTTAGIGTLEELHHHIFRLLANTADPHRLARTKRLLERYEGEEARFWVNEETKEHAVMNLGDVDSVSLHLYIPEIVRCKIVNPRTHNITWTTCSAKARDAPPAVHQRLLRIVASALLDRSFHGDCYSGAEDNVSSFSLCLLSAFQRDDDFECKRQTALPVEENGRGTESGSCARRVSAKTESERNKIEGLFGFERNAAPLADEAVLAVIRAIVELCTDEGEATATQDRDVSKHAAAGERLMLDEKGNPNKKRQTWGAMGWRRNSSAACEIFSYVDAAILAHVVHFLRQNEAESEAITEALTAGETLCAAAARVASRRCASGNTYYRMRKASVGAGESAEAEEEGGKEDAFSEEGKWAEPTRTKDFVQKLDEKVLRDLFNSASPVSSRLPPLLPYSSLDETSACQSTLCTQGDEDGEGEGHEEVNETHVAEGSAGEYTRGERQERDTANEQRGRHGKLELETELREEEKRHKRRRRAPLCGFWMHSEVWAYLHVFHLARFKPSLSDAPVTLPHRLVNDRKLPRLKSGLQFSPYSFFPSVSISCSWPSPSGVPASGPFSAKGGVCIFVCSGSPYIRALHEAFALAGFAKSGRIIEVHQMPDSGVMSVACLRAKMREVRESEREVQMKKENASKKEMEKGNGEARKVAHGERHEEGDDEDEERQDSCSSFVIIASAGRSGTLGGFDDFLSLRQLADETGSWLHIDSLVGGSFLFPREKPFQALCAGMGLADSLTWSAHAFLTASDDPTSPVAFFCRQDTVPLILALGHLSSSSAYAAASSPASSISSFGGEPVVRPSRGAEIGCGFPLWCFWKKLGDTGVANRVRQVYLRCRQLSGLLSNFPKRLKPPAFPAAPASRLATEERIHEGMRSSECAGVTRGEKKGTGEQAAAGESERGQKGSHRLGGDEKEERRGENTERKAKGLARENDERAREGTEHGARLTRAQEPGEDRREERTEGNLAEEEEDSLDDEAGNYDTAHILEEDRAFVRDHEEAVDHLVDAARDIVSKDPGAFCLSVVPKSSASGDAPVPQMVAPSRLGGRTDPNRGRSARSPISVHRALDEDLDAGTEKLNSFYSGTAALSETEQCSMSEPLSASRTFCDDTAWAYTPGAFCVKQTDRPSSFSVSFWWIPPYLRGEVLSRKTLTFCRATCEEIRFFVTRIFYLLSLLLERERAEHKRNEEHGNAVEKELKGSGDALRDRKWSGESEFHLSSDALSVNLVDDGSITSAATLEDSEESKSSLSLPPSLSVCILDPRVCEGDLVALLCLINRLGMLLTGTGTANEGRGARLM